MKPLALKAMANRAGGTPKAIRTAIIISNLRGPCRRRGHAVKPGIPRSRPSRGKRKWIARGSETGNRRAPDKRVKDTRKAKVVDGRRDVSGQTPGPKASAMRGDPTAGLCRWRVEVSR